MCAAITESPDSSWSWWKLITRICELLQQWAVYTAQPQQPEDRVRGRKMIIMCGRAITSQLSSDYILSLIN